MKVSVSHPALVHTDVAPLKNINVRSLTGLKLTA